MKCLFSLQLLLQVYSHSVLFEYLQLPSKYLCNVAHMNGAFLISLLQLFRLRPLKKNNQKTEPKTKNKKHVCLQLLEAW